MASYFISKAILKSKEVRYRAVITQSGRNIKSKTFRRKTDAKQWGTHYVLDLERQESTGVKDCTVTFSTLVDEYMRKWKGKDHDCPRVVSVLEGFFHEVVLTDITSDLIAEKLNPDHFNAPATYNRHRAILSSIFKFAVAQNKSKSNQQVYVRENPCNEIAVLKEDNKRVRYLSDEEKPRLIQAARNIGGKFYLKVLMALTTGMRKGELDKLRWNDIDFDRGLAILHETKNGSVRHTPVPEVTMDEVKKYRELGNTLIFKSTTNPDKAFDFRKQWLACLKSAEIEDFRWHDMRHDTASTLARDGKTMKEIAEILGHKSLASTDRYTHLCTEHKSQLLNDTMNKVIRL